MLGGDINDAGRADEGMLARHYLDHDGSRTASGSSNAFTVTSSRTIAALFDNLTLCFSANHTITGAATLNLNGIGAKSLKRFNGNALASGDIVSGQPVHVLYKLSADVFYMVSAAAALTSNMFVDVTENASPGDPAADDVRLYAKDVNGSSMLAYRDSAGLERVLSHAGELVAIIEDQKSQNTAPQSLTQNTDNVRNLNTVTFNRNSLVSLSSNRFTLPAGTWEIAWQAPHYAINLPTPCTSQSFLYNQSDSSEVARGTIAGSGDSDGGGGDQSHGATVVTIAASKAFEIRHRTSANGVAGGTRGNYGTEVYTRVTVRRA
jgi:hypothetical protein